MVRNAWQRWLDRRLPRARQVRLDQRGIFILPSGYGYLYLLVAVLLFFGGINYENNLILGLCFLMIGLFVVAILHTYRNLSGLTLRAGGARSGFVGGQGSLEVVLIARRRGHRALWLRWLEQTAQEVSVERNEETGLWLNLPLTRRGARRPPRLRVESRYPLGLLRAWSLVALDQVCLAWPRPQQGAECPARGGDRERRPAPAAQNGSEEFRGLRGYVPGDALTQVDWKGYARGRGLNVKLFDEPASGRLWLRYDLLEGVPVEQRLSILCDWVLQLSRENRPFALWLPGAELPPGQGDEQRRRALDLLARHGEAD
ncbi:DUF58 domain-containing protein [Alloalcanivorax gelatiniphagus]|uniref:DUF58 domain-containing protein n=1 Tax=Alloalcanivorax gelatiniphagus TaxID=1194167 RepID=A0ABY2XNQ4_9GAMM|nr:DUF58 domain-containing protein [Alloalcanivorax gelatiniphagus]TMW14101.1 DUF58 domain-containing protein [Alloalcanivorax gelatiniphagus]